MKYDDIINLPHYHVPDKPYMPIRDRAGQFMPFKSLKGYDDMVGNTADAAMNQEWAHIEFSDGEDYDPYLILDDDGGDERFSGK